MEPVQVGLYISRGGVCIEKSIPRGRGGGVCIEKSIRGGGSELSDQLLDPDVPTLASQDKLKVSPRGLPFVIYIYIYYMGVYVFTVVGPGSLNRWYDSRV